MNPSTKAKLNAYLSAIDHLRHGDVMGCDNQEEEKLERDAMEKLADKLDRECQRWFNKLKNP